MSVWDENSIEQLPGYMKISFEALFKSVKKIGEDTIKELGRDDITPYLTKAYYNKAIKLQRIMQLKQLHGSHTMRNLKDRESINAIRLYMDETGTYN
ncbi:hypothetical protein H6P81_011886 [Aristolochia fimbriata]|uniref:Terpene synthase metal-binding domain-containing protein n=1 Tax=Aristolochia fimbriata TaxID=158543 RepID=A0AAV7EEV0_ARIFI|nr:hypothetical protein H6P81_011886 [Aristolochia fimbriata]